MTYHVLARKWRPQTFSDLVGQSHVVKALSFALENNQIHHAYLLTGTRGVGKTSIARIFAKSLNCETNGISYSPCGQCNSCQEIKSGKFVDLIEVDAASRTGVDETRELIESVAYQPSKGRFKVYLIDEVHMFSKSSFNALLKTLEEPPEHVKFILATTDPEKLPITILSRCLQFNLKSLTQAQICQHLINICEAESIPYEKQALDLLATAGNGSLRDTLSITDQAIAYGQGQLNTAGVTAILGTIQPADIEAILFAITTNNPLQLSESLHRLDQYEIDARAFLIEVMKRLQQLAWAKEGIHNGLSAALQSTVTEIPKPLIHLWYDIAQKALPNLSLTGDARESVEMTLLRMLAFTPEDWLPRHRTLLDGYQQTDSDQAIQGNSENDITTVPTTENSGFAEDKEQQRENTAGAEQVQVAEQAQIAEETNITLEKTVEESIEKVKSVAISEHDSLEAAEADFPDYSNRSEVDKAQTYPDDETIINTHLACDSAPFEHSSDATEESLTSKSELTEPSPNQQPSQQQSQQQVNDNNIIDSANDSWQFLGQMDDDESPNIEQIKALMQRGSDISPPKMTENPERHLDSVIAEIAKEDNLQDALQYAENITEISTEISTEKEKRVASESNENAQSEIKTIYDKPPWERVDEEITSDQTTAENENSSQNEVKPNEVSHSEVIPDSIPEAINDISSRDIISHFDWHQVFAQLSLSDFARHFAGLGLMKIIKEEPKGTVVAIFDLEPKHEVILNEDVTSEVRNALAAFFQKEIDLTVNLTDIYEKTPSEIRHIKEETEHSELLSSFHAQDSTRLILNAFDGKVLEKTVRKINGS